MNEIRATKEEKMEFNKERKKPRTYLYNPLHMHSIICSHFTDDTLCSECVHFHVGHVLSRINGCNSIGIEASVCSRIYTRYLIETSCSNRMQITAILLKSALAKKFPAICVSKHSETATTATTTMPPTIDMNMI